MEGGLSESEFGPFGGTVKVGSRMRGCVGNHRVPAVPIVIAAEGYAPAFVLWGGKVGGFGKRHDGEDAPVGRLQGNV